MFENRNTTIIHNEILDDISNQYDKTNGSFIFDVTRPPAKQFEKAYESMNKVARLIDVENLHGEELEKFINQRTGQERRQATHAVGIVEVEGDGLIQVGDLFQTLGGVQFESTEVKLIQTNGSVRVRSVLAGDIGNVPAGQITEMPVSLSGINKLTNPAPTSEGYEEESDVELRQRYYERVQTPATSGNIYHYRNWAKEIPGVGAIRVLPLWNGDNTVKVIIIDSNLLPASNILVEQVQNHIDPGSTGLGEGEAPIGAFCTVVSALAKPIDINFNVVMEIGYDEQLIIQNVSDKIITYLKSIAFKQAFVSYAQIGGMILESAGVVDYTHLTVNGDVVNVSVSDDEVAIIGGVTIDS
ncbi:baseplate J family protein [[Bacillus] sp. KCTC 13219]|nr:baseplate J family protein [[Bacillus] sp. KCTC 13219]